MLSPFVVDSTSDDGYFAKDTLAGTRIRTDLKDVGSAISVVTQKFLQDTNSKNSADLLVYTTGTEVAAQGGNFTGQGDGALVDSTAYTQPVANTRVRGLASADNLRDFFLTDIPWDSYNVNRVDLQRGPNSILFGIGSPAGIINSAINMASFKDAYKAEIQVASFGSYRGSIDLNKVVIKDQLSFRFSALRDDTKYRQKPAFRNDHRVYGAVRFDPKFFSVNGAHTSFRANYEKGNIDGNNPRLTPPMDLVTPWFTPTSQGGVGKITLPWQNSNAVTTSGNPLFNPWVGAAGGRIFDGQVTAFNSPDATVQGKSFSASAPSFPSTSDATANNPSSGSYKGIVNYDAWAFNTQQPGYIIKPFKAKSLTDASIFDFYNNLIEGNNKRNYSKFKAYNLNLSQTFLNNKIGFEIAYDKQDATWGFKNFLSYDAAAITVDIMSTFVDGSPNPNVGRAMLIGGGGAAGSGLTNRVRTSARGTAYGEFDFKDLTDSNSTLGRILGRHVFTFSQMQQEIRNKILNWNNWYVGDGYGPSATVAVGQAGRDDTTVTYISGNLTGLNSPSGLNLPRITAIQQPTSTTVTQWNTTSRSFISYNLPIVNPNSAQYNEDTRPYTNARKTRDLINSSTFVWQGYMFSGNLVPMVGWRKDVAENFDAGPASKVLGIVSNYTDPTWKIPDNQADVTTANGRSYANVTGQTHTWSLVGKLPRSLTKNLPWGLDARAFYNRSQNFQPDASRLDILGGHIASPTGKTKDYGIAISALDGRIALKVNKYETAVTNATLSGELGNSYLIGAGEAWGQAAAYHLGKDDNIWPGDGNFGTTTSGKILHWQPADGVNNSNHVGGDPAAPYLQSVIDAQYAIQVASTNDWLSKPIPVSMQKAWGMNDYATGGGSWSMNSVAVTGDTLSKGTEFELSAAPIKGLEISMNASKTDAKRLNIAKAYSDWLTKRIADYAGPMGDMRLWGNGNWALTEGAGGTVRDKFNNEVLPNYKLALALNNSNVSELRPWRYNIVSNYSFTEGGMLKGSNVGLSYRWQDKQVTGYRLNAKKDGYDVSNPYFGPSTTAVDMWVGYGRNLQRGIKWRVQLNVRDVFATKKLIPVTVQADGTPGAYRIPEPRVLTLTNTFEF